jgi:hypothetical protein
MNIRPENEFIKISVLESAIEAQVMEAILKEENIAHRIRSFHDTAYDGLFQFQKGWGELFAPCAYNNQINEILENVRNSVYIATICYITRLFHVRKQPFQRQFKSARAPRWCSPVRVFFARKLHKILNG